MGGEGVGCAIVTSGSTAPATKQDIQILMEQMGKYYDGTERRLVGMEVKMKEWKEDLKDHFDVVAENIRHDLLKGALHDKIEQHEDRIILLEQHAGLAA